MSERIRMRFLCSILACTLMSISGVNCNKFVQIPDPISTVTSKTVFSSDATATAAMLGIYSFMVKQQSFSNVWVTYYGGLSADELDNETSGYEAFNLFLVNDLTALQSSGQVSNMFWQPAYFDIYSANSIIDGIQSSTEITPSVSSQLDGEAKFVRAFCYFYLTNLFGDVPLDLNINFNKTVLLSKSTQAQVYQQIIGDLQDAQNQMVSDFSLSDGQPIRANKWAATALLARVCLYNGLWGRADSAATAVINSGQFRLVGLDSVFLANSAEAILQLQPVNNSPYTTWEGFTFIPFNSRRYPSIWLTSQLLSAFQPGDQRRIAWVDSSRPNGNVSYHYYPYKYKVRTGSSWPAQENYMLLRLAEQYLIRAEAEANGAGGGQSAAVQDLNVIRQRAGLPLLSPSLTGDSLMEAVQQEWRIEFFSEWGHRWLDLRRWGIAIQTLDTISYKAAYVDSTQLLYPIPISEIQTDPNLKQNRGY